MFLLKASLKPLYEFLLSLVYNISLLSNAILFNLACDLCPFFCNLSYYFYQNLFKKIILAEVLKVCMPLTRTIFNICDIYVTF